MLTLASLYCLKIPHCNDVDYLDYLLARKLDAIRLRCRSLRAGNATAYRIASNKLKKARKAVRRYHVRVNSIP